MLSTSQSLLASKLVTGGAGVVEAVGGGAPLPSVAPVCRQPASTAEANKVARNLIMSLPMVKLRSIRLAAGADILKAQAIKLRLTDKIVLDVPPALLRAHRRSISLDQIGRNLVTLPGRVLQIG